MSWDIFVQDIPEYVVTPDDMPDDFEPVALGQRSEIIKRICEVVPFANFQDPAWGQIDGPDFSIEVSLGEEDVVMDFAFHVRGGDDAAAVVSDILNYLGFRAVDTASESGMFEPGAHAQEAMRRWRAYRDTMIRK